MKQVRHRRFLAVSLVLVLAMGSTGITQARVASAGAPVKIGLVILSGPVGANEQHMMQGFDLAIQDIQKAGGLLKHHSIQLVRCEDQVNPDLSTACTRRLIEENHLKALFLDTASPDAAADSVITGRAHVIAFLPSQRDTALTQKGNKWLFRTGVSGAVEVQKVGPEVTKVLHPKTVGILAENNSFGLDEQSRFQTYFKNHGINVNYISTFAATQTDFSGELTKVKAANPDVLLMIGEANHGAIVSREAQQLGVTSTLVASSGMTSPDLLTLAHGAMDKQYAWSTFPFPQSKVAKKFFAEFQKKYGTTPSGIAAEAYTGMITMAAGINKAGTVTNPAKLRAALFNVSVVSPIGRVKFNKQGQNVNAAAQLWKVVNGTFTVAK